MVDSKEASSVLQARLAGRACLKTTVNVETGSDLLLHIGKWVPYEKQSEALRVTHRGEVMLMIHCPWQLDGPAGHVVDSSDVHDKECWQENHTVLEGLTIRDAVLTAPSWDLLVKFERGFELRAFCEAGQLPENWFLLGPTKAELAVGPDGDLQMRE